MIFRGPFYFINKAIPSSDEIDFIINFQLFNYPIINYPLSIFR